MINPDDFIDEILETIKEHHKVSIKDTRNDECQNLLKSKDFNFHIYWELAYRVGNNASTMVPCICLNDHHLSYFAVTHLRLGKIRCNGCRVQRYKLHCAKNNLEYLSHRASGTTCLVLTKCLTDGYVREISSSELFQNKLTCAVCYEDRFRKLASAIGFEFLSFITHLNNKTRVLIRCNNDGYIRSVSTGELVTQKIMCRHCQVARYSMRLNTKNCRYVRHYSVTVGNRGTTYVEYTTESGLLLNVVASNLNRNKFAVTEDTHWNQAHSVYCIRTTDESTGTPYIKIGTANFPELRMLEFKLLYPATTETLASFDTRNKASKLEKYLHKLLSEHKASPLDVDHMIGKVIKAKNTVNCLSTKDGCTEWFKATALKELEGLDYSSFK